MKTRVNLVSNSSSTSFIINAKDEKSALDKGLELIKVSDLKKILKSIDDKRKEIKELEDELAEKGLYFMCEFMGGNRYTQADLNPLNDDDFISKPFDRDRAYDQNIYYETFQGDL